MSRRVVVTGLGALAPLGLSAEENWSNLIAGKSGISRIERFDVSNWPAKIAGQLPIESIIKNTRAQGCSELEHVVPAREQKRMDDFLLFGVVSADEAIKDSGIDSLTEEQKSRVGVIYGVGVGGLPSIEGRVQDLENGRRVPPTFLPSILSNLLPGHVSMRHGLGGGSYSVSSACASSGHALKLAYDAIVSGESDVVVAGGAEGALCRITVAGFSAMRALSTNWNEDPERASRPWDNQRDGFVLGEGASTLILELEEHARARGAKIYAEVLGAGSTGDAYHVAAPHPEGRGAAASMDMALKNAKLNVDQIDHVNAHGTSTPAGDEVELLAMRKIFGTSVKNIAVSSTKSSTGHLLGGSGALEAMFAIQALRAQTVPFTRNTTDLCEQAEGMNIVLGEPMQKNLHYVMSNSFGFGGANTTVIFGKY